MKSEGLFNIIAQGLSLVLAPCRVISFSWPLTFHKIYKVVWVIFGYTSAFWQKRFQVFIGFHWFPGFRKLGNLETQEPSTTSQYHQ